MAVRIHSVNLPNDKRIEAALLAIYGIGLSRSSKILHATKINPNTRTKDLTDADITKLRNYIEKNFKLEGDLKREVLLNIKRLKEIRCYRGLRHTKRLPVKGQRTKTNSRTVRGNVRLTATSGKHKAADKT
jgi:small subunit ribosomal protein S13